MSHTSPRFIEQEFNETMNLLAVSASERSQFAIIKRFFDLYIDDFSKAESYLVQLLPEIPIFSNPFLLAGLRPIEIEQFLDALIICKERKLTISGFNLEDLIDAYTDSLRVVYGWLGKFELHEQALISIQNPSKQTKEQKQTSLLVPVVEKIGTTLVGRLRSCSVSILGEAKEDSLSATFGVIGAEISGFLEPVKKAVRALYTSGSSGKARYWAASVQFKYTHAWHSGRSANLAISGLYYCELLKVEEKAEYFELNEAACVTGDLTESGKVLSVDSTTLIHKVEAAFFSWTQVLVVPIEQLTDALRIIETLKKEFPNRQLPVIGVGELKELFYDRRISDHIKAGVVTHTIKKIWKRKYSVVSGIIILTLSLIIGRLVMEPVDKNPVMKEFSGTKLLLKNATGIEVCQIEVGAELVESAARDIDNGADYSGLVDIDGDGINEIVWRSSYFNRRSYELYATTVNGDTLWRRSFTEPLDYKYHPYVTSDQFSISRIYVEDIDGDGNAEIAVTTRHEFFFPSQLIIINPKDGSIRKRLLHGGHINRVYFKNLDDEQDKEILLTGSDNSSNKAFFSVFKYQKLDGQFSTNEEYSTQNKELAKPLFYTILPNTFPMVHKKDANRGGYGILIDETKNGNIVVLAYEYINENQKVKARFEFDDQLSLLAIASNSDYDVQAKEMYASGKLTFKADGLYLDKFRDSLLYWDGEKLMNTPTLVNENDGFGGKQEE